MEGLDLITYAYEQRRRVLEKREANILKKHGQFLTPPPVARYMAKKYANNIAWDTEIWIAKMPSHMIHFNGDKFLGPR